MARSERNGEAQDAYLAGRAAWRNDLPRNPPLDLREAFRHDWLCGWDWAFLQVK